MKYSQLLVSCVLGSILLLAPACCTRVGCDSACAPRCAPACGDCTADNTVAAAPESVPAVAAEEQVAQPSSAQVDQALAAEGDFDMGPYEAEEAAAPAPEAAPQPTAQPETTRPVRRDDLSK